MGHKRLWTLPKSKACRLIIDELISSTLVTFAFSAITKSSLQYLNFL